ncbi:hypothetical protein M407DRAFT_34827 [Tulasnella calospora MUT 4182]|uniref:Uncharacterized protein n=1 Tax=Tulasnella calospora MUT 4182 TaxID=1051891 RepID=A0A0C3PML0_9AGAM|nr:hypothetical protein M407DRAFT_34827 [Tulasnella calospora MUT 4182]
MNSSNDPDQDDLWSGEFPSNASHRLHNDRYLYNAFGARATGSQASSTSGGPSYHELSEIPGPGNPPSSMEDYEIRFETHSLAPLSPSPVPVSLEFEDIVDLLALGPSEPHLAPHSVTPTPDQFVQSQPSGSVPLQIPTAPHFTHEPLGDHSMSASVPYIMRSDPSFLYLDHHRARSGSYSGPGQGPCQSSVSSPASRTTPHLAFNRPFHPESQRVSHRPPRVVSPSVGPAQHIHHFDANNHGHQPSVDSSTIQPSWVSPSEDSSSSASQAVSPAMSTSSLANLPSSSTTGGEIHRWRINLDTPGWVCDCGTNAKKRKRHLESCPNNPNKPTIECPCCPTVFTGGSRNSALRRHMQKFHEDQMDLLKKKRKD